MSPIPSHDSMALPATRAPQRGVDSVEVAGVLLQALLRLGGVARVRDLEQATGKAAAKVHRYLVSLVRAGLVRRHAGNRYAFGLLAHQIGLHVQHDTPRVDIVLDHLVTFVERVGQACDLAIWLDQGCTLVRWVQPPGENLLALRPGLRLRLTGSTTGRVFAAFLPAVEVDALVAAELAQPDAVLSVQAWLEEQAEIRRAGCAWGHSLRNVGINTLSVPVFDAQGRPVHVITMIGQDPAFLPSPSTPAAQALLAFARDLSTMLGAPAAPPIAPHEVLHAFG